MSMPARLSKAMGPVGENSLLWSCTRPKMRQGSGRQPGWSDRGIGRGRPPAAGGCVVVPCARVMDTRSATAPWLLPKALQAYQWRDCSGGSGPEHDPFPARKCRMKTIGMLSALCLCTMQLWGPFTAAAQVNPLQVCLGSYLLGSTVKNLQGKELGSIKDLVISPEDNRVIYAVLSFGGGSASARKPLPCR